MSNVIDLPVVTTLNGNPDRCLERAVGELEHVVIVGMTKGGEEYFASSYADGPNALWALERARHKLLSVPDREDIVR